MTGGDGGREPEPQAACPLEAQQFQRSR